MAAKKTSRAKGRKSVTRSKASRKSSARSARKAPRDSGPKGYPAIGVL